MKPIGPDDPRELAGYRLLARLGAGGMGVVYLSYTRGRQPVALKVIRREYTDDAEFRRRFQHEVRAARQVSGYHIVPVVDHDTTGERPWLASTFVPGLALDETLDLGGPLPVATTLQLVGAVAEALRAIHAAGVIHRDLKPSNILLGAGGPWVIDFGIARAADATKLTRSGGLIGTPEYMSPEHAGGEPLTPASDVFSLGLLAAVAATGRHPYGDGGTITLVARIVNTAFRPPELGGYPAPLRGILERCLAADPADRPSAGELAALCEVAVGRAPSDFAGWLPDPVMAEIARRAALAREVQDAAARDAAGPPPPGPPAYGPPGYGPPPAEPPRPNGPPPVVGAHPEPARPAPAQPTRPPWPGPPAPAAQSQQSQQSEHQQYQQHQPQHPAPPPQSPPQSAPAVGSVAPASARAGGRRVRLWAALLVAAVVAASVTGWIISRDDGKEDTAGGPGTPQPGASAPAAGAQTPAGDAAPTGPTPGAASTPPTGGAAPSAGYVVRFQDRPMAIRGAGRLNSAMVDFDLAKVERDWDTSDKEWNYYENDDSSTLTFLTGTGKSRGRTADKCREAADGSPLRSPVRMKELPATLPVGSLLCTVTTKGDLAMLEITALTPVGGLFDIEGKLTLWTAP
ncbi:serine/threonine-protein kinase [Kitasatospora sp. NPDC057015]|uniref:serine/threonine-protein kinase n=1 Tax=Kitasatospora sp. NPDC057015 TaxID=3346001 RepID=UPI00362E3BC2